MGRIQSISYTTNTRSSLQTRFSEPALGQEMIRLYCMHWGYSQNYPYALKMWHLSSACKFLLNIHNDFCENGKKPLTLLFTVSESCAFGTAAFEYGSFGIFTANTY